MPEETMLIGELGERLNVNPKTIRYYENVGLMAAAPRNASGYRVYTEADVERLAFILRAKSLDFSLDEIGEILALREQGEVPCPYVVHQIETKLDEVEHRIAQLRRLKTELEALYKRAGQRPSEAINAREYICHLIENQELVHREESQ